MYGGAPPHQQLRVPGATAQPDSIFKKAMCQDVVFSKVQHYRLFSGTKSDPVAQQEGSAQNPDRAPGSRPHVYCEVPQGSALITNAWPGVGFPEMPLYLNHKVLGIFFKKIRGLVFVRI